MTSTRHVRKRLFDEDIRKVFSHGMALVSYSKRNFGSGPDAAKAEFCEKSALIDFLEESGAQSVGNLKNSSEHPLGQRVEVSALF